MFSSFWFFGVNFFREMWKVGWWNITLEAQVVFESTGACFQWDRTNFVEQEVIQLLLRIHRTENYLASYIFLEVFLKWHLKMSKFSVPTKLRISVDAADQLCIKQKVHIDRHLEWGSTWNLSICLMKQGRWLMYMYTQTFRWISQPKDPLPPISFKPSFQLCKKLNY